MILAKDIMLMHTRVSVKSDSKGREIAYGFISTGLPGLPVVNEDMEVIGIVTEFNLLGAIREGLNLDEITAKRIMSKEPISADSETPAERLIEMMLENNFTVIPIVRDKKLEGVVDRSSVMDAYLSPSFYKYLRYLRG